MKISYDGSRVIDKGKEKREDISKRYREKRQPSWKINWRAFEIEIKMADPYIIVKYQEK